MALDWSRNRRRANGKDAIVREQALMQELARDDPQVSKAELREQAASAMATWRGRINRLATVLELKCPRCRHYGKAAIPPDLPRPRFRCSRCGMRL